MTSTETSAQLRCAQIALASALLAPFAHGAVNLRVWIPLCWLWIGLGVASAYLQRNSTEPGRLNPSPKLLTALHVMFVMQSVPLPPPLLSFLSPGSYAAHFLPPDADQGWAPLTASPTGTLQAWLLIAGLQGLSVAVFGGPVGERPQRWRAFFLGVAGVGGLLALEGLIQSKAAHPHWLYGIFPVPGATEHERGIFGPYYNRDHYSNVIAIAASVTAGLLGVAASGSAFRTFSNFMNSSVFARTIALSVGLLLMLAAGAASGSRGGLVAMATGLLVGLGPLLLARPRMALIGVVVSGVALFGAGIPSAFARLSDVDFEASRLSVWADALRVSTFFPLLGSGIGAFAVAYWPYQRVVRFEYWPHLHNEYLQWAIEGGLIGLILAAIALRQAWLAAPRFVRSVEARPALAGLTAAIVHAAVDCTLRIPANAAWASLLLTVLVLHSNKKL